MASAFFEPAAGAAAIELSPRSRMRTIVIAVVDLPRTEPHALPNAALMPLTVKTTSRVPWPNNMAVVKRDVIAVG